MGDLAKYIAEVVEFIVAGVLVLFSLLLLGYVVVRPDLAELPDELPFLTSLGGLLPVVGIALIYALGIIAEGMSRIVFEHGLGELTATELTLKDSPKQQQEFADKVWAIREVGAKRGDVPEETEAEVHRATVRHFEGVREEWRMYVLAHSASLNAQVEGQLKRLRIERAAALAGAISSLALLIDVALAGENEGLHVSASLLVLLTLATAVAARLWLVAKQLPEAAEGSDDWALTAEDVSGKRDLAPTEVPDQQMASGRPHRKAWDWWRQEVQAAPARALAVTGLMLTVGVLVHLVVEVGTEAMALRAALLVATLAVTACAVTLSLVRLKRYLSSIIRCYRALTDQPVVVVQRQKEEAATP